MKHKRGYKSPEAAWRFLRTNDKLKGVIISTMDSRKLTVSDLARLTGIYRTKISGWIRGAKPADNLTDFQLLKICEYLGIELDLQITIK